MFKTKLLNMKKKEKLASIFCILTILILYNWRETVDEEFLATESCPACFGENQCNKILKTDNFVLTSPSKWKIFNKLLNVKNVYYGQTKARSYVIKKLAHDSELHQFDVDVCRIAGHSSPCSVSKAMSSIIDNNKDILSILKTFKNLFQSNDALKCDHDKIPEFLFGKYSDLDNSHQNIHHFVSLMALNPEPVVLQAFHDIFPVPLFLGACGRVVVEEYAGQTLTQYYDEPWLTRARLAIQLLKMANSMSENEIRFYITDPSSDNFAVNHHGLLKLIDNENVVLVDSRLEGLDSDSHFNDGIGCKNCFSFDYEELCSHQSSDHNYFAICKGLLSSKPFSSSLAGGFLHSIPGHVEKQFNLSEVIEECAMPTVTKDRRFIAKELLRLLQTAVQQVSDSSRMTSDLRK